MTDLRYRAPAQLSDIELAILAGTDGNLLDGLTEHEAEELLHHWPSWRRPSQRIPANMGYDYRVWFIRAGRGFGKTRTGAETCRIMSERCKRIALVAPTRSEVRDIMIEGESGLMAAFPSWEQPIYEPSRRRVVFPSGCIGFMYSAETPDRLRGPQHEWAWVEEPASMKLHGDDMMSNLLLGLRLGDAPWALMTGTPKMLPWLRRIAERTSTVETRGSTYENISNLAPTFVEDVVDRYEGTRLGRQELHAEWLEDVEGALWLMGTVDDNRMIDWKQDDPWASLSKFLVANERPAITQAGRAWKTIVAVDPPGETAECGIVVGSAPVHAKAGRDHAVIWRDASMTGRPEEWGSAVVRAYRESNAAAVHVESNQGGDMTRATIHAVDPSVVVKKITARGSKQTRAEPVAALYERGWIHHVGAMPELEEQLTTWIPSDAKSPDRLDALVHCVATLLPEGQQHASRVGKATGRNI